MACIYQITNMINGKYYIGSAQSFERRTWQHKYDLKRGVHKNPRLQAAWNKYGEDAFVFEVLEEIPADGNALAVEDCYLVQHVGRDDCYNINPCAESPRLGVLHTEESKQKTSANRTGKAAGKDHYRYGTTLSAEVRKKISDAQKGRANPRKGLRMSEQGRTNVAAAVKRGRESHFYGVRPAHSASMQRVIYAVRADGSAGEYPSLTYVRDTLGASLATIIRACKSGNTIRTGTLSGWRLSYTPLTAVPKTTEYPPTRQLAKETGAAYYFTGEPCARGHVALRKVKGSCVECLKEDTKKDNAARREKPKSDAAKAAGRRYYEKKLAQDAALKASVALAPEE